MALTFLQRKKMQQGLVLALVVVLFITAAVLWLGFFNKGGGGAGAQEPETGANQKLQQVEINFDILKNPLLEEFDAPPEPVLAPEFVGRSSPFLPF